MTTQLPPEDPRLFHITHIDNIEGILREGGLWCDAERIRRELATTNIGIKKIKARRLLRPVKARAGGTLGEYVPFNFCSRSVMLYRVCRGHDDYQGGQEPIVHLVTRVSAATALGRPWAFTDRHAELGHALHFDDVDHLSEVPWGAMRLKYWEELREERQAEFLVKEFFPWTAVLGMVVRSANMKVRLDQLLREAAHRPPVAIRPTWYYEGYP